MNVRTASAHLLEEGRALTYANFLMHPNYVYRIAAEPTSRLDDIVSGETDILWKEALSMRATAAASAARLCLAIELIVPQLQESGPRHAALEVKRCLHNLKACTPQRLAPIRPYLDEQLAIELEETNATLRKLAQFSDALAAAHARELAWGAPRMGGLLSGKNLQCALSYSNGELLGKLLRHFDADGGKGDKKTIRNLEDSLLQYYARASTKTSPLSSFTVMYVGGWNDRDGGNGGDSAFDGALERRVEVKAALLRYLMAPWLADYTLIRNVFPLYLNPTIKRNDGRITLQSQTAGTEFVGRTWGTGLQETVLDASPILGCITHVLALDSGKPIMADELIAVVCQLAPKLSPASVDAFLGKLQGLGYLLADTGFVEQQELLAWAEQLCQRLDPPGRADAQVAIAKLAVALEIMRGDDVLARTQAGSEIQKGMAQLADATGVAPNEQRFRTPFYENCYLRQCNQDLSVNFLAGYEAEFALLHPLSHLLDLSQQVSARLCDFFIAQYGADGHCDDAAGFLERFDSLYTPAALAGNFHTEGIAPDSPLTTAMMEAREAFQSYVSRLMQEQRDVELDPDTLSAILAMVPPQLRSRSASYSYVVQSLRDDSGERLILNQVFGGRSAIMSRFLEVLNDDEQERLRGYLVQGADAGRVAEVGGVFGFNANRHPQLADAEVVVPPMAPAFGGTTKLDLSTLTVRYSASTHRLVFHDERDEPISLFYQGFLNPGLLPKMHRTLALGFTEGPSFAVTGALLRRSRNGQNPLQYCPRLSLGRVVLSRRTWLFDSSICPNAAGSASEFYLATRQWQQRHQLPERFFVRAVPSDDGTGSGLGARNAALRDVNFKNLKPFYVDLRNVRLVRLLQNMMKRHAMTLCVTELLPDFDGHPVQVDGGTRVAELHFELTSPAKPLPVQDFHWYTIRVAYFDERRPLMLEAIAPAVAMLRAEHGIERIFVAPHWKFGPHVDIVFECESSTFLTQVYPAARAQLSAWLELHPSTKVIDLAEYDNTSRWAGTMELDQGPYFPLLSNNSVTCVPYIRPPMILIPAVGASREQMLCDTYDIMMTLYRLKDSERDGFFLTLFAMLLATADTPVSGMREGYMSMRSHADYFFAAHDGAGALQRHFKEVETRRSSDLDRITVAIGNGELEHAGLSDGLRAVLGQWMKVLGDVNARSHAIVEQHYEELIAQSDQFSAIGEHMSGDVPAAYLEKIVGRSNSEIGEAFINTEAGRKALQRPEFLAYRMNVNLFYTLLPLLEVAPLQKFLLCHLVAGSVERVHAQDWREKLARLQRTK